MHPKNCPKCNIAWEEEHNIYDHFISKGKTKEEATKTASQYGCTKENPRYFGVNVTGIEILGQYDGVSQWECGGCKTTFNRWSMKEIIKA